MLIASDDQPAKQLVAELAIQLGLEPVDAGGLAAAADLEHVAMLWIRLAYTLGHGPDISIALQRRPAP
jgi:predicted dinucleotide-binding enzyme